jgi:general secretion pathway protein L
MIAGLISRLAAFLRWWGRELAALVPDRWLHRPVARRRRLILLWRQDGPRLIETRGRRTLRDVPFNPTARPPSDARGAEIILRFPAEDGLRRRITLPRAAEAALGRVLRFEIDRLTPWPADTVAFGARRLGPAGDAAIAVELSAVPRDRVEAGLQAAAAAGWRPDVVDLAAEDPAGPPGPDLRHDIDVVRRGALRRLGWLCGLGLGVPAAIAATWLIWAVAVQWSDVSELRDQVASARGATAPVSALQAEIRSLEEADSYLGAQRRTTPYISALIEAVSHTVPDNAWLTELSLDQGTLRLGGFADDTASLIPLLSAMPQLDAVAFAAPSVRDSQRNQDRFVVTATLVPAAAGPGQGAPR